MAYAITYRNNGIVIALCKERPSHNFFTVAEEDYDSNMEDNPVFVEQKWYGDNFEEIEISDRDLDWINYLINEEKKSVSLEKLFLGVNINSHEKVGVYFPERLKKLIKTNRDTQFHNFLEYQFDSLTP